MYTPERQSREEMGRRSSRRRKKPTESKQTWSAVGLAVVSTILPGVGHIWAGRRRSGIPILVLFLLMIAAAVCTYAWVDKATLLTFIVNTDVLTGVIVCALLLAVGWSAVIVSAYHIRRPGQVSPLHGVLAALVVGVLSLAVSTPPIYAARQAYTGRDVISNVFGKDGKERKSKEGKDPWAGKDRINVLLLGGDGGADRTGIRTDTMIVASIDTKTGDTVLISLPRNMLNAPMPERLRDEFPNGYTDLLNALYVYGTDNPKKFPNADNPGEKATQDSIQLITGLKIDYYALVNLKAFADMIDAIGGITVNVEKRLPIGPKEAPVAYIEKGKQHLTGQRALWYARSRAADDDYHRNARQRCVLTAIAKQAEPTKVLKGFQKIAATTKKNIRTDIPNDDLPALLQLGEKAKKARITSLALEPPLVNTADPDYEAIPGMVDKAIEKSENARKAKPSKPASKQPTGGSSSPPSTSGGSTVDPTKKKGDTEAACGI